MKKKTSTLKTLICVTLVFFFGYSVRSLHYREDMACVLDAQSELRIEHSELASELSDIIERVNNDLLEIIDQNREHPVMAFGEEEE